MVRIFWKGRVVYTDELSPRGYKRRFLELLHEYRRVKANTIDLREIGKSYFPCLLFNENHWLVTKVKDNWVVERRGMEHIEKPDVPDVSC